MHTRKQAEASEFDRRTDDDAAAREQAAVENGRTALERLEEAKAKVKAARAKLDSQCKDKWTRQAEALVQLKATLDAIHADMRSKVGMYRSVDCANFSALESSIFVGSGPHWHRTLQFFCSY